MAEFIDSNGNELDDDDMHDQYDMWLDDIYPEVEIGHSVFNPSEILKELEPITYRVGFSDFVDFQKEDGNLIEFPSDQPECEECQTELSRDEVVECLANDYGQLICVECFNGEDDDEE